MRDARDTEDVILNALEGIEGRHWIKDRILTALSSAGLAVVPVEPSDEMVAAMRDAWDYFDANDDVFRREYRAAIAAALPPLASGGG